MGRDKVPTGLHGSSLFALVQKEREIEREIEREREGWLKGGTIECVGGGGFGGLGNQAARPPDM